MPSSESDLVDDSPILKHGTISRDQTSATTRSHLEAALASLLKRDPFDFNLDLEENQGQQTQNKGPSESNGNKKVLPSKVLPSEWL